MDTGLDHAAPPMERGQRFLIFRVGQTTFALDLCQVRQIIDCDTIFPLPLVGEVIVGVVYHQEMALPVVRPRSLLEFFDQGNEEYNLSDPDLILVVEWEGYSVGLLIDRIEWVVDGEELELTSTDLSEVETIQYRGKTLFPLTAENLFTLITDVVANQG